MIRKPSFKVQIILGKKKFQSISQKENHTFQVLQDSFSCHFSSSDLKKRMQFILSLICEKSTEVSFRFCDTDEMLTTNKHFRGKNYPTDVLSFPHNNDECSVSSPNGKTPCYLGDILICVPVCTNQAKKYRMDINSVFEKMMIHGLVHLKGFNHERNESAWRVMNTLERSLQNELIKKCGKPDWANIIKG